MTEAPSVSQHTQANGGISVVAGVATTASLSSGSKRSAEPASGSVSRTVSGSPVGSGSAAESASGHVSFGQRLDSAMAEDAATPDGVASSGGRAGGDAERVAGVADTSGEARRSASAQHVLADRVKKPSTTPEGTRTPAMGAEPSQQTMPSRLEGKDPSSARAGTVSVPDAGKRTATTTDAARAQAAAIEQNVARTDIEGVAGVNADTSVNVDTSVAADSSVPASIDTDALAPQAGVLPSLPGSVSPPVTDGEKAIAEATAHTVGGQARTAGPDQAASTLSRSTSEPAAQQLAKGIAVADDARVVDGVRSEPAGGRAASATDVALITADAALTRPSGRQAGTLLVSGTDGRPANVPVDADANASSTGNTGQQEGDSRAGRATVPASETVNGLLESDKQRLQEFLERQPDARPTLNSGNTSTASAAAATSPALIHMAAGGWAVPAGITPTLMSPGAEFLSPTTPTAPSSVAMFGQAPQAAFGENVRWMVQQGLSSASFTVTPHGMGPVSVTLDMEKDGLQIAIHSPQATTREALDLLLPRLREQLQAAGYEQVSVDVSDGGQQHSDGDLNEESGTDTAPSNTPESVTGDTSTEIDAQAAAMRPGVRGGWHRGMFNITV